jgi:hypothetical protein
MRLSDSVRLEGREDELPNLKLPRDFRYLESKPVFFGHYWLNGSPSITAPNAACLDFSVANSGYLTAYRWSGEGTLTQDCLDRFRPEFFCYPIFNFAEPRLVAN